MPLSNEHVREILRLIDQAEEDELRAETEAFTLYVLSANRGPRSSLRRRATSTSSTRRCATATRACGLRRD
jgi:hypothetical protein